MKCVMVTGLSGAGKSQAVTVLEDMGYYCVDNLPPALVPSLMEWCLASPEKHERVAMVVDVRSGFLPDSVWEYWEEQKRAGVEVKVLFLDCGDDELMRRYKETRRCHPLYVEAGESTRRAVALERERLAHARTRADYTVDTTSLQIRQLRERLTHLFASRPGEGLVVECVSFGFKYGAFAEADLLWDVRCFPNPFYRPKLKHKTGLDAEVQAYVRQWEEMQAFEEKLKEVLTLLLPLYEREGKGLLTLAVGCTGGKHRSVTVTEDMAAHIRSLGYRVQVSHRDIARTE